MVHGYSRGLLADSSLPQLPPYCNQTQTCEVTVHSFLLPCQADYFWERWHPCTITTRCRSETSCHAILRIVTCPRGKNRASSCPLPMIGSQGTLHHTFTCRMWVGRDIVMSPTPTLYWGVASTGNRPASLCTKPTRA